MNVSRILGNRFLWRSVVVPLLFAIALSTGCASFFFERKMNQLKIGMTKEEVQTTIEKPPTGWERRQIASNDLREVWIYHVPRLNSLTPLYPDLYILTFSNGKLLGWNLPHPYDPTLINLLTPPS